MTAFAPLFVSLMTDIAGGPPAVDATLGLVPLAMATRVLTDSARIALLDEAFERVSIAVQLLRTSPDAPAPDAEAIFLAAASGAVCAGGVECCERL